LDIHGALALHRQGLFAEALAAYAAILKSSPRDFNALNLSGAACFALGDWPRAAEFMERAREVDPAQPLPHSNLSAVYKAMGRVDDAIASALAGLRLSDSLDARESFCACAQHMRFGASPPGLSEALARALSEPWTRPIHLARPAMSLLLLDPAIARALSPDELSSEEALAVLRALSANPLACALLRSAQIPGLEAELLFTRARRWLALPQMQAPELRGEFGALACAIACQCHLNEFAWDLDESDRQAALGALARLRDSLAKGKAPSPMDLGILGARQSLSDSGLPAAWVWADPAAAALWAIQVEQPMRAEALKAAIVCATPIGDGVSSAVRSQYEQNPYPRWSLAFVRPAFGDAPGALRAAYPARAASMPAANARGGWDILVAGCGTGQQSCELSMLYPLSRVDSIDLSRVSLAYAAEKAAALGLGNATFRQADISRLDAMPGAYDMVESVGVIHHMADPEAALRQLCTKLKAGGVMKLGLYSHLARRAVFDARALAEAMGSDGSPESLRALRRAIRSNPGFGAFGLVEANDFYSLSEFRDLAMHAHEVCFDIPGLRALLASCGLEFLGFELPGHIEAAFKALHPSPDSLADFAAWEAFEQAHPSAFIGMYQFHAQKRA